MTFKIKDGVAIGTTNVFNNSGQQLAPVVIGSANYVAGGTAEDGIKISGRGAGTGSYRVELIPTILAANRTLTIPDVTGTVITTGDSGTVTSTMIADGTIVNADINASAAIAISKLAASTISGVSLGNNLNALTIGTGLSGTSYNGGSAVTIAIDSTVATLTGTQTLTNKTLTSPTINGGTATALTGLAVRDTSAAFDVTLAATSSTALTAARTLTLDMVNAARTIKLGGNLDLGNTFTTTGNANLTLNTGGSPGQTWTVTVPSAGTLATLGGTETLTNKTLTTPNIGEATATSINKVAITAPATSATLTIANGKTLTASNTLTFTGTDASNVAFGSGGTVAYTGNKLSVFAATTSAELANVISDETGSGALVFGTSPTFATSIDGGVTFAAFASSTALTLGYNSTAASTTNISTGATANATTKTINIGTGGAAGSTTNINLGAIAGTVTVGAGTVVGTLTTQNVYNTVATTVNAFGAATSLAIGNTATGAQTVNMFTASTAASTYNFATGATANATTKTINIGTGGAAGSTTNINLGAIAGTVTVGAGTVVGTLATQNVYNTVATTVNFAGAATTLNMGAGTGTTTVNNNLTVSGNLTVNGTTTTVNSTTTTLDDPIITLGGDAAPSSDDSKDRGVEFRWHTGTAAKIGFFGFDDSTSKFTFIPEATNSSEVFTGTKGTIDANLEWADVLNKPTIVSSVTGTSPVASSGGTTPAISLANAYGDTQNPYAAKTANHFLAAPNGSSGVPTFRAIVAADIPTLNQNTTGTAANVTGTVAVANGGTGQTTYTDGQLLIGNSTGNTLTKATLTAGTGITITNGNGSISIAASGGTGTVTSIATENGITGGTITTTGTLGLTGQALALHNLSTNGIIARTGSGTVAARSIAAGTVSNGGSMSIADGDGVAGNPTISISGVLGATGGTITGGSLTFKDSTTSNDTFILSQTDTTIASTTATAVVSLTATTRKAFKALVFIEQGSNRQVSEVLVLHNGTTSTMTEYAVLETGSSLATLTSDISSGNVRLLVTMASATSATVKVAVTAMR